jgi:hypothetical protein
VRVVKGSTVQVVTDPFDATPSSPTAVAVTAAGTTLSPAPVATVTGDRVAVTLTAAAHTANLDRLTVTVSATVSSVPAVSVFVVDVVGSHYVTRAGLRTEANLADETRYPDPLLDDTRDAFEEYVEEYCGVAWVPSYGVERHVGNGRSTLALDHVHPTAVRRVVVDGVAQDVARFQIVGGYLLEWIDYAFDLDAPVEIHVEHGEVRPPNRLRALVAREIRADLLARSANAPTQLLSETVEGVTVRYSTPDYLAHRPTGSLHLDAALNAYRRPRASLG